MCVPETWNAKDLQPRSAETAYKPVESGWSAMDAGSRFARLAIILPKGWSSVVDACEHIGHCGINQHLFRHRLPSESAAYHSTAPYFSVKTVQAIRSWHDRCFSKEAATAVEPVVRST